MAYIAILQMLGKITLVVTLIHPAMSHECSPSNVIPYEHTPPPHTNREGDGLLGRLQFLRPRSSDLMTSRVAREHWQCEQRLVWRDLGPSFFPRHIQEAVCSNSTCYFGHYSCKPSLYVIRVLSVNDAGCNDVSLPTSLRARWRFVNVQTATYCQCGP